MKGLVILLLSVPLASPLAVARAATLKVNSTADNLTSGNGQCTLREAIANVNAAADTTGGDCAAGSGAGDTIKFTFAMPATIRLRLGELLIQRDVSIVNPAPGSLYIDGVHKSRVFEIAAGSTSMRNVTIEHGNANLGGGVMVDEGAAATLTDCRLSGNTAHDVDENVDDVGGGGIYNAGTLTLVDCVLIRNEAKADDADGGGIYNTGTLELTNCTLARNAVSSDDLGAGGGIHNEGSAALTNCILTRNSVSGTESAGGGVSNVDDGVLTLVGCSLIGNVAASAESDGGIAYGGGVSSWGVNVTLSNCRFIQNRAVTTGSSSSLGGAIYNEDDMALSSCTLSRNLAVTGESGQSAGGGIDNSSEGVTVTNSTLSHNVALVHGVGSSLGGGVYDEGGITMTSSTLTSNRARSRFVISDDSDSAGGGIYTFGATVLTNCTLSGNTTHRADARTEGGGGIGGQFDGVVVTNTIVTNSGAAGNCEVGMFRSGGHNLSSDGTCFTSGGTDLLNTKPRLAPLADYGGPTQTMALCTEAGVPSLACRAASPAIDAGDDAVTGPPDDLSTDQRGLPRKVGAHVDIGAYEVQ